MSACPAWCRVEHDAVDLRPGGAIIHKHPVGNLGIGVEGDAGDYCVYLPDTIAPDGEMGAETARQVAADLIAAATVMEQIEGDPRPVSPLARALAADRTAAEQLMTELVTALYGDLAAP